MNIDLRTCKPGDTLHTRDGEKTMYESYRAGFNYPHQARFNDGSICTYRDDGRCVDYIHASDSDAIAITHQTTKESTMSSINLNPQIAKLEAELAEMESSLSELKRLANAPAAPAKPVMRWYTGDEVEALVPTHSAVCMREKSTGANKRVGRISYTYSYSGFTSPGDNVDSNNFEEHEYSLDGGKTWNDFGVPS